VAGFEALPRQRQAEAARRASDDREVLGHAAQDKRSTRAFFASAKRQKSGELSKL
jgi:hypothetical protein